MKTMTPYDAIGEALAEEMRRDATVLAFGEGIATKRHDLVNEFGAARVRNTPLAEGIIAGTAAGAAATGPPRGGVPAPPRRRAPPRPAAGGASTSSSPRS